MKLNLLISTVIIFSTSLGVGYTGQAVAPESKLVSEAADVLVKLREYFNGVHPPSLSPKQEEDYVNSEAAMLVAGLRAKPELISMANSPKYQRQFNSVLYEATVENFSRGIRLPHVGGQRNKLAALKFAFLQLEKSPLRRKNLTHTVSRMLSISH